MSRVVAEIKHPIVRKTKNNFLRMREVRRPNHLVNHNSYGNGRIQTPYIVEDFIPSQEAQGGENPTIQDAITVKQGPIHKLAWEKAGVKLPGEYYPGEIIEANYHDEESEWVQIEKDYENEPEYPVQLVTKSCGRFNRLKVLQPLHTMHCSEMSEGDRDRFNNNVKVRMHYQVERYVKLDDTGRITEEKNYEWAVFGRRHKHEIVKFRQEQGQDQQRTSRNLAKVTR